MKQQITKNAIKESFLHLLDSRSFDKVTVKSIVEDCGLTRNTFYYYYEDTYDIFEDIIDGELSRLKRTEDGQTDWKSFLSGLAGRIAANQRAVLHVYRSSRWPEVKVYLVRAVDAVIDADITRRAGPVPVPDEAREMIRCVCRSALGGLARSGLADGDLERIREKIELADRLFGDSVNAAVARSIGK